MNHLYLAKHLLQCVQNVSDLLLVPPVDGDLGGQLLEELHGAYIHHFVVWRLSHEYDGS